MTTKSAQILVVAPHPACHSQPCPVLDTGLIGNPEGTRISNICVTFNTPIGPVAITASAKGLLSLTLPLQSYQTTQHQPPQFIGLIERLQTYFNGSKVAFPDRLDLNEATPFQSRVWSVTRLIPYGETRSYRWVAEQMGQPAAVRAVGQALARNPLPVIIPCHRVIAGDGKLGGYSGGLEMKRKLLRLEHIDT